MTDDDRKADWSRMMAARIDENEATALVVVLIVIATLFAIGWLA